MRDFDRSFFRKTFFRKTFSLTAVLVTAFVVVLGATSAPAQEGKRVALVIGNNAYSKLPADKQLKNAINDARAMRDTLRGLNFEVFYGENADRAKLVDMLADLTARLSKNDMAFFFFAGHGVSFSGANYLLPSDIPLPRSSGQSEENRLADLAIAETDLVSRISKSGARVSVVVLDACRDNPLQTGDRRSVGGTRGLQVLSQPRGVFAIYSASFGQAALDRLGPDDKQANSVFTRVFAEKLKTPGLDLRSIATETRDTVASLAEKIGEEQVPAYYDQVLGGNIYLAGLPVPSAPRDDAPRPPTPAVAVIPPPPVAPPAAPAVTLPPVASLVQPRSTPTPSSSAVSSMPNPPALSPSTTLAAIKKRGMLICGVSQGLQGFSSPNDRGEWSGLDAGFCQALAAAIFDDPKKVKFVPLTAKDRFTALLAGEIDVLARNTTKTLARETSLGLRFGAPNYYDGQGFLLRKSLRVNSALELNSAAVCVQAGTTTELNVTEYFRQNKMKLEAISFATADEALKAYDSGRCDTLTSDASYLYILRGKLLNPNDHIILADRITREPIAPVVRQDDATWLAIVTWTHLAMVAAEELGVTRDSLTTMKASSDYRVQRLLGKEGDVGRNLGLSPDWVARIVAYVGNYGELFERSFGKGSALNANRDLNALTINGGLQTSSGAQ